MWKMIYSLEKNRKEEIIKQLKKEEVIVKVGYGKWSGLLCLLIAGLNILAFIVRPYPGLRIIYMGIIAIAGLRYLTSTAFSVNTASKEIIFHSLVGPLKRRVRYACLELEGEKIFYVAEKNGKKGVLSYFNTDKKDLQFLRERIKEVKQEDVQIKDG